ncbi:MAG: polysaccharide biosynthesis protein [Legionella sp.]|jgi:UDP-glucose 4-epimerase|nr:polysaccharide biosynthesis protein [Legionella sp.]
MFENKTLLITGGTGSFGHAVLKRFLDSSIQEIRIFSRDEKKQDDMRRTFNSKKIKYYIGDVRDYSSISDAMRDVDYVFHAAALKQVPSCEFYPMEAVRTNVLGTENVLNAGINHDVQRMIVLSTDKAVYPINAMGISKAMAEKIMLAKSRQVTDSKTSIFATRYGNVMASRGSVIPLFIEQIQNKQPLTITDPTMTRFLMSLEDSVELVLHAFNHGTQGDIFVQKAPAATIGDVAQALLEIFRSDSEIRIIGTRHGEKCYESLVSREEMAMAEDMGAYYRITTDNRDLNYDKYVMEGEERVSHLEDYTSHNTQQLNIDEIKTLLLKLDFVQEKLDA